MPPVVMGLIDKLSLSEDPTLRFARQRVSSPIPVRVGSLATLWAGATLVSAHGSFLEFPLTVALWSSGLATVVIYSWIVSPLLCDLRSQRRGLFESLGALDRVHTWLFVVPVRPAPRGERLIFLCTLAAAITLVGGILWRVVLGGP